MRSYNTTGSDNTAIGFGAGSNVTTANNVICIGATYWCEREQHHLDRQRLWRDHTKRHHGASRRVRHRPAGHSRLLGAVQEGHCHMDKASEAILSLRPVTFHYKTDAKGTPQFGLIAEEVAKVNPALVLPDKEGKPYTVRYDAVNAMLLNEFLKEHRKVEKLEANAEASQQKQIEALTAGLQKVSAQLELNKSRRKRLRTTTKGRIRESVKSSPTDLAKTGWNHCRAREFSKYIAVAARAERGFSETHRKRAIRFALFRIRIFAYPVHGRLSQPFPSFLSQLGGAMQRELLLHAHLMCLNRFNAYMQFSR